MDSNMDTIASREGEVAITTPEVRSELRSLPNPEPVPDRAAYDDEREKRLQFDPRCNENYQKFMSAGRRTTDLDYLPTKLDIENVSRCNFRCTMCQVSDWTKGTRAADLSLEDFKRLIDEQYGLVEIKLQGMGEPMIQGDDFFEMIRYARERHIWVRTVTNASLLHLKENYKKIIDSGVNELQVSIDGADAETFQAIRRGSVFSQVVENCRTLNEYCEEKGVLRTKMWTVVQRANRHQLRELVDLAGHMKFKTQVFSLNLSDWGQDDWRDRNNSVTDENALTVESALELAEYGQGKGIKVAFWNVSSKYSTEAPDRLCPWPFERAYVASDSRVVPCCMIANPDVLEVGEGIENGFSPVWNGADYADFRHRHLSGDIPRACQNCYEK